jgi:high affinity Mn2+ porin
MAGCGDLLCATFALVITCSDAAAQSQPDENTASAARVGALDLISRSAPDDVVDQQWNLHVQNTDIVQGDPGFSAKYSGPNSLNNRGEVQETITADLYAGVRLWRGAEAHVDLLMWQGFGLSQTFGIEDYPNGDAYKAGTQTPNFTFAHFLIRQTIGLGGEQEQNNPF